MKSWRVPSRRAHVPLGVRVVVFPVGHGNQIVVLFKSSSFEISSQMPISHKSSLYLNRRSFRVPQKAWGEQEDALREKRTEPARLYPQRAPDSRKLTQTTHEMNQAELPMRPGVNSKESGRSWT